MNRKLFFIVLIGIVNLNAQGVSLDMKIVASDRGAVDNFGWSIDIDGDYVVVGAPFKDENVSGGGVMQDSGAVYIFENNGLGNWNEIQKIIASDSELEDQFGSVVAISGNYVVVGAPFENEDENGNNTLGDAGAVYMYEIDVNGVWNEVQKIVASDRAENDYFGYSVAMDGSFMIVGAFFEDEDETGNATLSAAGSVYVFKKDVNGVWNESQKIVASDRESFNWFGEKVSISGDYLVIAAKEESDDAQGNNRMGEAGAAYVFQKNVSDEWFEVQKITASDRSTFANFGTDVDIDGNYIAVGAILEGEDTSGANTLQEAGAAYIFEKNGSGTWLEVNKLVPSDRNIGDEFGISVAIHGDRVIIGANREDEDEEGNNTLNSSGSAYIFERNISGSWNEIEKVVAFDRGNVDNFGFDVALSEEYIFVAANWENEDANGGNSLNNSGSVYIANKSPLLNVSDVSNSDNYFSVFPNPVEELFTIDFQNIQEEVVVTIYNALGQEQRVFKYQEVERIDEHFDGAQGIYFIKIENEEGSSVTKRFIKM